MVMLDGETGRVHGRRKAAAGLDAETETGALLLSAPTGDAGRVALAADVLGHVPVERLLAELAGSAGAAEGRVHAPWR